MYKDSDKQREAVKKATQRYRAERGRKAYPKGVTSRDKGVTDLAEDVAKYSKDIKPYQMPSPGLQAHCKKVFALNFPKRGKDIKCFADLPNDMQATLIKLYPNVKERKERTAMAIKDEHMYPSVIGKLCNADYEPQTTKRGKDIKTFADLPPDVQQTIDSLSMVDGKINQRVKANRTAIAINYQHLFPDRYHSTGSGAETPWERSGQETFGKTSDDHSTGVAI